LVARVLARCISETEERVFRQHVLWLRTLRLLGKGAGWFSRPPALSNDHTLTTTFGSLFDDLLQPCGVGSVSLRLFFLALLAKG